MMILEILSRSHELVSRERIEGSAIRIGRAYDNDIILDDPHVAAHHLALRQNEVGEWSAEDLGSTNGLFTEADGRRHSTLVLSENRVFNIGHTALRLRGPSYPVAPERVMVAGDAFHGPRAWAVVALLAAALFGIEALGLWQGEFGETKLSKFLTPLTSMAGTVIVWTALWTLLSRLFSGQAQFLRHLRIALIGVLAMSVCDEIIEYAAYIFSITGLSALSGLQVWIATALTTFFHLRAISNTRLVLKAGLVSAVLMMTLATLWIAKSENESRSGQASVLRTLKTPALRIAPQQSEAAFFGKAETLKAKLDRARTEEKPGETGAGLDSSD